MLCAIAPARKAYFNAARAFSTLLRFFLIAVVTTPIRAMAHVIPHILPFFPPLEGAPADRANLGGAIGMMGHQKWLRLTSVETRGSLVFKPADPGKISPLSSDHPGDRITQGCLVVRELTRPAGAALAKDPGGVPGRTPCRHCHGISATSHRDR